jgi:translocation and assembly module TamB
LSASAVRRVLLIFLTVLGLAGGAAWWFVSRDTALQWLVAEAIRRSGGALSIEGVEGSLLGPVKARRIAYETPGMRIVLEDVAVDASPREMAHGRLTARSLDAQVLRFETKQTGEPVRAPDSLALPLPVSVARATIREADLQGYKMRDVSFAYEGGAEGQSLRGLEAVSDHGSIEIELRVDAQAPFGLAGSAALSRGGPENDWTAEVKVSGNLSRTVVAEGTAAARGARARGTALLAAFEPRWLQEFSVSIQDLDPAVFDGRAPHAQLRVEITGEGAADGFPTGLIKAANQRPGMIAAGRVPVISMDAHYRARDWNHVDLSRLRASLGAAGSIAGAASIQRDGGSADLTVSALDLRGLHQPLRATRMNGSVRARFTGADQRVQANVSERGISFAMDATRRGDAVTVREFRAIAGAGELRGSGEISLARPRRFSAAASLARVDASKFGDYPQSSLNGDLKVRGELLPDWRADLSVVVGESTLRGIRLKGNAAGEISTRGARNLKIAAAAGANALNARGSFGRHEDILEFTVAAKRLAELDPRLEGALNASGRLSGTFEQPGVDVDVTAGALGIRNGRRVEALRAHLAGTAARHVLTVQGRSAPFDFSGRVEGKWDAPEWTGSLVSFDNKGAYPVTIAAPVPVRVSRTRLSAGPAEARVTGGRVALQSLSWSNGRLDTRGELSGMPVAPFLALAGAPAISTDLRVAGRWDLATTTHLNGTVSLVREAGDIMVTGDTPILVALERLRLDAKVTNDAVEGTLDLAGSTVNGHVKFAAASLARNAPIKLDGRFDAETLKLIAPLTGTRAVVDGRATVAVAATGTLGAPVLTGSLAATGVRIESPQYGVRLHDGALRAELTQDSLKLSELRVRGGEGTLTATGTMSRGAKTDAHVEWRADGLQVFDRPDLRLNVDGKGTLSIAADRASVRGALAARQGYYEFEKEGAPKLGSDVVVIGRPRPATPAARPRFEAKLLDLDVQLDLGERMRIVGAGIDTMLGGKLRVQSTRQGLIEAHGTLASSRGVYYAFGQRLDIEKGRLIFDGPPDNPALDIVAKRKNLQVEAGVEVTGTVRVPRVQLVSTPPVPDSEKLAWLTFGRPLHEVTATDAALLQAAASAVSSGGKGVPLSRQIAGHFGLDDVAVRGGGEPGSQVVALGKRFSDKLYVEYQQGMAATSAMLRLSYVLTRAITLRLDAGATSSFGVYFNKSFE